MDDQLKKQTFWERCDAVTERHESGDRIIQVRVSPGEYQQLYNIGACQVPEMSPDELLLSCFTDYVRTLNGLLNEIAPEAWAEYQAKVLKLYDLANS